ncbi:MAG: hypothetical protein PHR82_09700, partial [Endomicrobiaceae bacterium]|nr:hypothetical protein [Endomicrobiaceae bacterium]
MRMSPANRTLVVFGFVNVMLLIRALSLVKTSMKYNKIIIISIVLTVVTVSCAVSVYGHYLTLGMILIIAVLSFIIFSTGLNVRCFKIFAITVSFIVLAGGFFVNPVQSGTAGINETPLAIAIRKINANRKGLWMTEGTNFYIPNYIIMQGVQTVNSTNTYPNIALWQKFDKDGKYQNVYNRYCHISTVLTKEPLQDKFQLIDFDAIKINLTTRDLRTLNVSYVFTKNDLSKYSTENIKFEEIYSDGYYKIYGIKDIE